MLTFDPTKRITGMASFRNKGEFSRIRSTESRHLEAASSPIESEPNNSVSTGASHAGESTRKRKTRGPTRNLTLILLEPDAKLPLRFNELGQAVGPNASKLANKLGTLVRNVVDMPITYEDWDAVPKPYKDKLYKFAVEKFDFEQNQLREKWIIQSMGKKYCSYKNKLKTKFCDTEHDMKDMLKNRPDKIPEAQWKTFVEHVTTDAYKKMCAQNRKNRSKQVMSKTTGTKSFARVRDEETIRAGSEPTRMKMFCVTHTRKNGQMVDEASKSIADRFETLKNQVMSESSSSTISEEDIFSQVMGPERHGRVRTYGQGPTPTTVFGGHATQADLLSRLEASNKRNEELQSELVDIKKQMEEDRRRNEESRKAMDEERRKCQEERLEFAAFMNEMRKTR